MRMSGQQQRRGSSDDSDAVIVDTANALLRLVDIPVQVSSARECVPSLFIALFEGLLATRLHGLTRIPTSDAHRIENVNTVMRALERCIGAQTRLDHISAAGVVAGAVSDVIHLLEVFQGLAWALGRSDARPPQGLEDDRRANYSDTGAAADDDQDHGIGGDEDPTQSILAAAASHADSNTVNGLADSVHRRKAQPIRTRAFGDGVSRFVGVNDDVDRIARLMEGAQPRNRRSSASQSHHVLTDLQNRRENPPKRLRFNLNTPHRESVHPLLEIHPSDTPHMRALKLKRAQFMRERSRVVTDKRRRSSRPARSAASKDFIDSFFQPPQKRPHPAHDPEDDSEDEAYEDNHSAASNDPFEGSEGIPASFFSSTNSDVSETRGPDVSQTEQNLREFRDSVNDTLGRRDRVSKETNNRVERGQLRDTKKQLDGRIHRRQVNMSRVVKDYADTRPIKVHKKHSTAASRSNQRLDEESQKKRVLNELNEQRRRVMNMEKRRADVEKEVAAIAARRKFKEEKMVDELYKTYLTAQREAVRDLTRLQRDEAARRERKRRQVVEAKENFQRDQLRVLEEELEAAKREERILVKAHTEEMRKLAREQKEAARRDVDRVKRKLEVDDDDLELQKAAMERLRSSLRFVGRPR